MQRSGGLLNFTANQDASVMSLGPLFSWCSAWLFLISSFGSHLLSRPTMKEVGFHWSRREKQQNGQLEVSGIWASFIFRLASGLFGTRTMKMM